MGFSAGLWGCLVRDLLPARGWEAPSTPGPLPVQLWLSVSEGPSCSWCMVEMLREGRHMSGDISDTLLLRQPQPGRKTPVRVLQGGQEHLWGLLCKAVPQGPSGERSAGTAHAQAWAGDSHEAASPCWVCPRPFLQTPSIGRVLWCPLWMVAPSPSTCCPRCPHHSLELQALPWFLPGACVGAWPCSCPRFGAIPLLLPPLPPHSAPCFNPGACTGAALRSPPHHLKPPSEACLLWRGQRGGDAPRELERRAQGTEKVSPAQEVLGRGPQVEEVTGKCLNWR